MVKSDESVTYRGLTRGASLLASGGESVLKAIENKDWDGARQRLSKAGIFVGASTLEIEVIKKFPSHAKTAFAELASEKVAERFATSVDQLTATDEINDEVIESYEEVLKRIERVGKGRFAQRLSNKLLGRAAPQYISDAIAEILSKVLRRNGDIK
jgi:putative ATP-dependent endonuclease of OLD family